MLPKESGGVKGGASGTQKAKAAEGSQTKGWARKAQKALTLGKSIVTEVSSVLTCIIELGKSEVVKCVWAASAVGALCTSHKALRWSIDALRAQLDMYDLEVWSIPRERETCMVLVKELEEMLAVEESTDEEVEMREEKERYDARRGAGT